MNGETAVQKAPINMDMTKGVLPANYGEVMQMAALVHNSGLAPKSLGTVQQVAVAMMMAMEIGLPVITGIQNIAVINGKAGIWGDATLALVRASGIMADGYPKEKEAGSPYTDEWTFFCTVKRKGGSEVTGSFSWADAKRAGLATASSPSPWAKYPKRMMQWKARQWVYRDEFGDVLRGMKMAEELYDYIDMEKTDVGNGWKAPESPAFGFDYNTFRRDLVVNQGFDEGDIDIFEKKLADHYKKPVETVRQEIGNDTDGFVKSLTAWCKKNGSPHPPVAGKEDKTDPIREEFINLKSAGYSTWVHKNKARIPEFSNEIQYEIREKWGKLYPGIAFPTDKEEEPEPSSVIDAEYNPEPTNEPVANDIPWITCPRTEMSVNPLKDCAECEKDCQVYQEWKMENGGETA